MTISQRTAAPSRATLPVLVVIGVGAVVAVLLGVYGKQHTPTGDTIATFGFGSMIAMKVWLASIAGVLAIAQLLSALWMYGRLGSRRPPANIGAIHRVTGLAAVLVSLPVAFQCLWALGFQSADTRVLIHSVAGCLLYGAFVTKVLTLHFTTGPSWLLPAAGTSLLVILFVVVLTSSLWYFTTVGMPSGAGY